MIKIYKLGDKTFMVQKYNVFVEIFSLSVSGSFLLGLTYVNYTYLGNAWYVGLFVVFFTFAIMIKLVGEQKISKQELIEELEE